MPAQSINVCPPALLEAAASVAVTAEQVAAPHAGTVPLATPGSPADGTWAGIAAGIASESAQMAAQDMGEGPAVQATTQSGVAQLQGQDEQNAEEIGAVGQSAQSTLI